MSKLAIGMGVLALAIAPSACAPMMQARQGFGMDQGTCLHSRQVGQPRMSLHAMQKRVDAVKARYSAGYSAMRRNPESWRGAVNGSCR